MNVLIPLIGMVIVGVAAGVVGVLLYAEGERNERDYDRTIGEP